MPLTVLVSLVAGFQKWWFRFLLRGWFHESSSDAFDRPIGGMQYDVTFLDRLSLFGAPAEQVLKYLLPGRWLDTF